MRGEVPTVLLAMFALLAGTPPPARAQDGGVDGPDYARLAPYSDITWSEDIPPAPTVLVANEQLELLAIEGRPVSLIVEFAHRTYGSEWRRRFDEDLVELLTRMEVIGHRSSVGRRRTR